MDIRKPTDSELKIVLKLSPEAVFDGTLGAVKPTNEKIEKMGFHVRTVSMSLPL